MKDELPPYDLQTYDNGQDYFETDYGRIYTFKFENITAGVIANISSILIGYDMSFHYFGFTPDSKDLRPDPRMQPTIGAIAKQFFQDNKRVMLYVCDSMDGRAEARQRLFSNWADSDKDFVLDRIDIEIGDDDVIYCGVVTKADLPDRDVLDREFIDKAESVFTQKF